MRKVLILLVLLLITIDLNEAKRRKRKSNILRQKETNAIDFIRLAAMRLVYGIATRVGLGEQISEALGGVFVPPGVDDYDYGGANGDFALFDREDEYDY